MQKESNDILLNKLDKILSEIENIRERLDRLEGKTDDLHHYVPFVGWLENVGENVSQKFKWLKGYKQQPLLVEKKVTAENLLEIDLLV